MPRTLSGLQSGEFDEIDIFHKITCNGNSGSLNQVLTNVDGVNTDWKTVDIPPQLFSGNNININQQNRIDVVSTPSFNGLDVTTDVTANEADAAFITSGDLDCLGGFFCDGDMECLETLDVDTITSVSTINSTPIASYLNSNYTGEHFFFSNHIKL
eukprot:SAG11_NODE_246_length_11683_cov_15.540142_6_plen_156_part_00